MSAGLKEYPNRLATQRNIPEDDYILEYNRILGTAIAKYHRHAWGKLPRLIACSKPIANDNELKGPPSIVVNNGVDLDICPTLPTATTRILARGNVGADERTMMYIYVGPLIERKNPLFLINSFLQWSKSEQHQLWIIGGGSLLQECLNHIVGYTNIHITGHVSDVRRYYEAADVFISASSSEGFPNAVIEALAFGLPLVLSDIPCHREIIDKDNTIGNIYPLGDSQKFCESLGNVETSDRTRYLARRLVESEYSAKTMAERYLKIYRDLESYTLYS